LPAGQFTNSVGMSLVLVPAGEFDMGSASSSVASEQQHRVRITRPFYIGVHEVTQGQFQSVMGSNPSQFTRDARGQALSGVDTSRLPVDSVLWTEAVNFCQRLSGRVLEHAVGRRYRLPTEAEWEYACRAGTTSDYHTGDRLPSGGANFKSAGLSAMTQRTMVVGSYAPNSLGLFDMHGNIEEWCSDYYDWVYYRSSPRDDPPGPASGFNRVARGGSYLDTADDCRSARRVGRYPGSRVIVSGFRVVCELTK
jgi:formylglycine-generating enzyme required for sulfatase activity